MRSTVLYLWRMLTIGLPLCAFIALAMSIAFNEPFTRQLVFSLCIGLSCMFLIDGGRRLVAWGLRRWGIGQPEVRAGWPGWEWMLIVVVTGVWGGIYLGYALAGWWLGLTVSMPGLHNPRTLFVVVTVSLLASLAVTIGSWGRARLAATEAQAERAQRAAAENQLKLLESQLEPHMLFNTLANLRVLIALDPPRAQAMLDRLIAFLRATLSASRVGTHSLAAEFERLADYLALMQVRMGPRLAFAFDLPAELRELPVPPLLLQPLVENCIAHGLEPKVAGGRIDIAAARDDKDRLVLTVRDSGVGLGAAAPRPGTRFGLVQVRERLAALYGGRAGFHLEPGADGTGTEARIVLPLEPSP
jgi:LytS/YehU family sensor histidine kinase